MEYEERLPPEHINTSKEHPIKELAQLLAGSLLILAILLLVVHQSSDWLAKKIPIETEQKLFADFPQQQAPPALQAYLDARLQALLTHIEVPQGTKVTISVSNDDTINAFATPGSHIVLMRGLLVKLKHENALSMLLGHELAHVIHRDPLVSIARGASVSLLIALVKGSNDLSVLNGVTQMALLGFSRDMEDSADAAALRAVGGVYGHTAGTDQLFIALKEADTSGISKKIPAFMSTHPALNERIKRLEERSQVAGFPHQGELTPLPKGFGDWLSEIGEGNDTVQI